jgi:hypothetical protein
VPYELLANLTFMAHGVFAVLVVPSAYLAFSGGYCARRTVWAFHNLCIVIMAAGQVTFRQCPLVTLEQALRDRAGTEMWYEGSYVRYVVEQMSGYTLPSGSVMAASITIVLVSVLALLRHSSLSNQPLTA